MKLNQAQRELLAEELKKGAEIVDIAPKLNVSRYCIYNEFKRSKMNRDNYDAKAAQTLANERRKRCRKN